MTDSHTQKLEQQVLALLVDELGDHAQVEPLPKRDEVGYVADYVARKMSGDNQNLPYILVAVDGSQMASDTSKRLGQDRARVTAVVAYRTAQRRALYLQRRMAARWAMYVRRVLQGRLVGGGPSTSEGVIRGFDMERVVNTEALCLYRASLSLALSVDLDNIALL